MYKIHHLQVVLQTRKHRLTKRYALVLTVMVGGGGEGEGGGGGGGGERARAVTIYSPILGSGGGFINSYSCISSSQ